MNAKEEPDKVPPLDGALCDVIEYSRTTSVEAAEGAEGSGCPTPKKEVDNDIGAVVEETNYEVERIVKRRYRRGKMEYKVKWKGYDVSDATWEPAENLIECKEAIAEFESKLKTKSSPTGHRRKQSFSDANSSMSCDETLSVKKSSDETPSMQKPPDESPSTNKRKAKSLPTNHRRKQSFPDASSLSSDELRLKQETATGYNLFSIDPEASEQAMSLVGSLFTAKRSAAKATTSAAVKGTRSRKTARSKKPIIVRTGQPTSVEKRISLTAKGRPGRTSLRFSSDGNVSLIKKDGHVVHLNNSGLYYHGTTPELLETTPYPAEMLKPIIPPDRQYFTCRICGQQIMPFFSRFQDHLLNVHNYSEVKIYCCPVSSCGWKYKSYNRCEAHIKRMHTADYDSTNRARGAVGQQESGPDPFSSGLLAFLASTKKIISPSIESSSPLPTFDSEFADVESGSQFSGTLLCPYCRRMIPGQPLFLYESHIEDHVRETESFDDQFPIDAD
uniref:Chromo domain-containing protein n=1 Tax=Plectus sambesii TaxID=2011161 RepID=A0A914VRB2_9BILA